jgi:hypothetical protein
VPVIRKQPSGKSYSRNVYSASAVKGAFEKEKKEKLLFIVLHLCGVAVIFSRNKRH